MRSTLTIKNLLRLGLFQMSAGMVSVLLLGMLNRVLVIELGMSLLAVSVMIGGGHYLGALISIPIGHLSDTYHWRGYHRLPFLGVGTFFIGLLTAAAPYLGLWIAQDPSLWRVSLGFIYFILQGIATYTAGTVFLSLITDLTDEEGRGRAVGLIWTMLMIGILLGVFIGVAMLRQYTFTRLVETFVLTSGLVWLMAALALWKQEVPNTLPKNTSTSLKEGIELLWSSQQTRLFFFFLVISLFAYFMQDVILEPFGGQVFGLDVSQTTRFNAYMMIGVIIGTLGGGLKLANRWGKKRVALSGAILLGIGFGMLAIISVWQIEQPVATAIFITGLGMGLFTAGSVSMMMDMTLAGQAGLFAGAWTLATAVAKFPASIGGGGIQHLVFKVTQSHPLAYGAVFAIESLGFVITIYLLSQVTVERFKQEVKLETILAAVD